MQEEYRAFDKSWAGSMKRLLTNLGGAKLLPLIVTYCTNFDKWGNFPNVLNLTKNGRYLRKLQGNRKWWKVRHGEFG
jgi:glucuronate isomerase